MHWHNREGHTVRVYALRDYLCNFNSIIARHILASHLKACHLVLGSLLVCLCEHRRVSGQNEGGKKKGQTSAFALCWDSSALLPRALMPADARSVKAVRTSPNISTVVANTGEATHKHWCCPSAKRTQTSACELKHQYRAAYSDCKSKRVRNSRAQAKKKKERTLFVALLLSLC